jgi:hypothetical protein
MVPSQSEIAPDSESGTIPGLQRTTEEVLRWRYSAGPREARVHDVMDNS